MIEQPSVPNESNADLRRAVVRLSAALDEARGRAASSAESVGVLQRRLVAMIEASRDGYVSVDSEGSIVAWSRRAEEIFGWRRDEVVGHQFTITPPGAPTPGTAGIEQFLAADGNKVVLGRDTIRAMHKDGFMMPVEVTVWTTAGDEGGPLVHAFVSPAGANAFADHSGCRAGAMVASSTEAMIGQSIEGRVLTWNNAAEHIFGYPADEVVGRHVSFLVPPEAHEEFDHLLRRVALGHDVPELEVSRLRKDGSVVEMAERVSATHDATGAMTGFSIISRDITDTLRAAAELQSALYDANESDARSRRFLADAAHQLRTPIAGIQACAQALHYDIAPAERERMLAGVVGESTRASRLMASLLQMARLDRGEGVLPSPCDLLTLCEEEAERIRRRSPHLAISVIDQGSSAEKPDLDANAVAEILGNLLDNARRHARKAISISARHGGNGVEVRVADDGPGVAPELATQVFERFASLDGKGGSGLGLPIAKGLAQAHGGDLCWDGDAFVLSLPA